MAEHYTAVIEVYRATPEQKTEDRYKVTSVTPKQKVEVARVIVRSASLETLKKRIIAHTELIEEN